MVQLCYRTEHVNLAAWSVMGSQLSKVGSARPANSTASTWVQTERSTHEAWGRLTMRSPRAASMAHFLAANMERNGALVASYATLAKITGMSVATVRRAIDDLKADRWIEVVQIGGKGGANAFVVNERVAWAMGRDQKHMAVFSATILADRGEQQQLDTTPLRRIPVLQRGEMQLPTGPGEEPPSQPALDGFEPDLPALTGDAADRAALEQRGQQRLAVDDQA